MFPRLALTRSAVATAATAGTPLASSTSKSASGAAGRRLHPFLGGYGPGRPGACRAVNSAAVPLVEPEALRAAPPSTEYHVHQQGSAGDVPGSLKQRQKMPLGSDRRTNEGTEGAGPSASATTAAARAASTSTSTSASPALGSSAETVAEPSVSSPASVPVSATGEGSKPASLDTRIAPLSTTSQPVPPASVVHALVAGSVPLSPIELLEYFQRRPYLYSPTAARALTAYAERVNDLRTLDMAKNLLATERMPTLNSALSVQQTHSGGRLTRHHSLGLDMTPNHKLKRKFGSSKFVNVRYARLYPPIALLPDRPTPQSFLQYQHRLQLKNKPLDLPTAVEILRSIQGANKWHELALLELELVYTSSSPESIIDNFCDLAPAVTFTRQTLHVAVVALLRMLTSQPEPTATSHAGDWSPHIDRLDKLRKRFTMTAGSETWRHVALRAVEIDDEGLARFAFIHGRKELGHDRVRAEKERAQDKMRLTTAARPPAYGADAVRAALESPVYVRFNHEWRDVKRWLDALGVIYETKGWATRGPLIPPEKQGRTPRQIARWVWVGRKGEEAAANRKLVAQATADGLVGGEPTSEGLPQPAPLPAATAPADAEDLLDDPSTSVDNAEHERPAPSLKSLFQTLRAVKGQESVKEEEHVAGEAKEDKEDEDVDNDVDENENEHK
ncbi:uncharacterized protein EHS24_002327 [Apiotrichum porosum]|uniref:Uncharacterized protein n=1 Tax=Apiotrichum porosum TaxID=105984 RepID=A0A427XI69_9TREE|nr:uncharacterized protein EHS24_002327 [Apiotrichum porosum]RSH78599.1 hypothetical protein EHS24_002327 [Apiotrichum porosum]